MSAVDAQPMLQSRIRRRRLEDHKVYHHKGVIYDADRSGAVDCCKFCYIIQTRTGTKDILYEDERLSVFRPLNPAAACHFLIVPKVHIRNITGLSAKHLPLLRHMRHVAEVMLNQCQRTPNVQDKTERHRRRRRCESEYSFHTPLFNSIDHVHMHAMMCRRDGSYISRVKYRAGTWWCRSYDQVYTRLNESSSSHGSTDEYKHKVSAMVSTLYCSCESHQANRPKLSSSPS